MYSLFLQLGDDLRAIKTPVFIASFILKCVSKTKNYYKNYGMITLYNRNYGLRNSWEHA